MQAHLDILKDRKTNRKYREVASAVQSGRSILLFLVVAVVFACSTAIGIAAQAPVTEENAQKPDTMQTPAFPYMAEITGDNVYYRSGPGTNFYECGKLKKGDKVKVISKQFSWYRIVPPPQSFAWISMQYIDLDPTKLGYGKVNGDRVRVYAGSERVKPHYSTSLLGKLNKGDSVKLLGQQLDDYYKIAPPPSTFLWVSTYFTKPLPPEKKAPLVKKDEDDSLVKPAVPKVVKIDAKTEPEVKAVVAPPAPEPVVAKKVILLTPLQRYQALKERIEAEKKKPIKEQDYKQIKKDLDEIAKDTSAGKIAIYAKKVYQRVEAMELAISVNETLRKQNEQLAKLNTGIEKDRASKLADVKNMGKYAVTGQLEPFALYGKGHYRILDDSGKMICYALPSTQANQEDLSELIGKKVGLVGMIQPHLPTKKAMVRFSQIVELQ